MRKAPSADLWPGQTDETEVGFSYATIDRILFRLVDGRRSIDEVVEEGFERAMVERVDRMVAGAEFKRQMPPIAKVGPADGGHRLPLSAAPAALDGWLRRPPDDRWRRATVAPGTLYVVATPIGNLGDISLRAIDVLRAVAVVAAEDTRLTRRLWARHGIETHLVSYHAQSSDRRAGELLARLRAGEDVALVTDAGTPLVSDPGGELVSAWADEGGRVVPIPGPRRSWRRSSRAASRRPAGHSRGSCLGVAGSVGSASRASRPTTGRPSCSRRPAGRRRPSGTWLPPAATSDVARCAGS